MLRKSILGLSLGTGAGVLVSMRKSFEEEATHPHKLITTLQSDPHFTRLEADPEKYTKASHPPIKALEETGGLSQSHLFIDKSDPTHTYTYVYAGSRTVGFPFVVHGGVLGTLLTDALSAAKGTSCLKIEVQYKRPTFANQFLVIETSRGTEGQLKAEVRNLKNKVLVEANGS